MSESRLHCSAFHKILFCSKFMEPRYRTITTIGLCLGWLVAETSWSLSFFIQWPLPICDCISQSQNVVAAGPAGRKSNLILHYATHRPSPDHRTHPCRQLYAAGAQDFHRVSDCYPSVRRQFPSVYTRNLRNLDDGGSVTLYLLVSCLGVPVGVNPGRVDVFAQHTQCWMQTVLHIFYSVSYTLTLLA